MNWVLHGLKLDEPYLVKRSVRRGYCSVYPDLQDCLGGKGAMSRCCCKTYFGDVRDCYSEITALDFDGIGLDFTEGKQTMALVQKMDSPRKKFCLPV